jgi:hypothetical protein
MACHPALRRKEILTPSTTWVNHEAILLREISQPQKDKAVWLVDLSEVTQIHRK